MDSSVDARAVESSAATPASALVGTTTSHGFATAFLAGDMHALAATLADDVALDSPVITRRFQGKAEVLWLLGNVMDCIEDPIVTDQVYAEGTLMMAFKTAARGRPIQGVHLMRLDREGLIRELTVHMRPLSGLSAFASEIGPALAGRRTPQGMFLALLSRPLALMTHLGDRLGSRMVFRAYAARSRGRRGGS